MVALALAASVLQMFVQTAPASATLCYRPSNDSLANADVVGDPVFWGTHRRQDNSCASSEYGEPRHYGHLPRRSVWFRWTAPGPGDVSFSTCGATFDTVMAVYLGSSYGGLTPMRGNDDACGTASRTWPLQVQAGETYSIVVTGASDTFGTFDLRGTFVPRHDDRYAWWSLGSPSSGSWTTANHDATRQPGEPWHAGVYGERSVWFMWQAPSSATYRIDTSGSNFDTLLGVYNASVNGEPVVAGSDDANGDLTSAVVFQTTAGTNYKIAVDGKSYGELQSTGTVRLNIAPTYHQLRCCAERRF